MVGSLTVFCSLIQYGCTTIWLTVNIYVICGSAIKLILYTEVFLIIRTFLKLKLVIWSPLTWIILGLFLVICFIVWLLMCLLINKLVVIIVDTKINCTTHAQCPKPFVCRHLSQPNVFTFMEHLMRQLSRPKTGSVESSRCRCPDGSRLDESGNCTGVCHW